MMSVSCKQLSAAQLMEYWLDELGEAGAAVVEDHLFHCASCTAQLESIVGLGVATRELLRQGRIAATLTPGSLDMLRSTGLRLREYHLDPGGSVNCTITPDDDLVVSHLHLPLAGVRKVDLVIEDLETARQLRMTDIGFDPASNEVTVIPRAEDVRKLRDVAQCMRLFAMDGSSERLLGEYVFHHTRHPDMK